MKISEKQIIKLMNLAHSFATMCRVNNQEEKIKAIVSILDEITNQQSDELMEVGKGIEDAEDALYQTSKKFSKEVE